MIVYDFVLPIRLITYNKLLRMHFRARKEHLNQIAWYVRAEAGPPPASPLQRVHIIIERFSTQEPDPDGIRSTAKGLLDVLQPVSKRHPLGLGYIENDNSKCVQHLEVRHIASASKKTRVIIREV